MARTSERRAEHLLNDLLDAQGWNRTKPPLGDVLFQAEYKDFPDLHDCLKEASKSGSGFGIPEALLVDEAQQPITVIEAKGSISDLTAAIEEAEHYASAFVENGFSPLAIGLAGFEDENFELRVKRWDGHAWQPVTYDGKPIGWVPNRKDTLFLCQPSNPSELRPTVPPQEVLAARAEEINRLLRESDIRDELRPAVVAAVMVALWQAGRTGESIRRSPSHILKDINEYCQEAFGEKKRKLARTLRVDTANSKLARNARRIVTILERLNIAVLTAEHDYLGQLYEAFFRYTGGNTIGQYFTPRHIATFMADMVEVAATDNVLDPACGSGGFLIAAMDRMVKLHGAKREDVVHIVAENLVGFESEPVTAALCVANMILRGDGSTGIFQSDSLASRDFPKGTADKVLMNPPFPHKNTDTPAELFVDRALEGLKDGGLLAALLPSSILAKKDKGGWRGSVLKRNTLEAVCQLPDELFQPYASATTSIVLIRKGVAHQKRKNTVFVRLNHDGLLLKKGVRVQRDSEPNHIEAALDAIHNKKSIPGFSGTVGIEGSDEWSVGAYIPSAPPEKAEFYEAVDVLLRRLGSFYVRYAKEVAEQRAAIAAGELKVDPYRALLSGTRLSNASRLSGGAGSIAESFDIFYGMKELHSRDGIPPGRSLIISPTEGYNGCYGWLEFPQLLEAPFVTVAQTGSIGEAFVQLEPCAVNDDCLVLLPKKAATEAELVIAAATLHAEKWRFSYGRKLTPARIADFVLPSWEGLEEWVSERLNATKAVAAKALELMVEESAEIGGT